MHDPSAVRCPGTHCLPVQHVQLPRMAPAGEGWLLLQRCYNMPSSIPRAGAKRTKAKIVASRLSIVKGFGQGQQTGYQQQSPYQQARRPPLPCRPGET